MAAAPLAQIVLTAFLVNSRHVFYALSFPLHRVQGKAGKAYSTFALTDEAYALTASDTARSWPSSRILWLQAAVAAAAAVTWGLRALPFTALAPLRASAVVGYLSARMPLGVMVILVAYTLRALPLAIPAQALPDILALTTTIGLHLWRRNAVLSILGGTAIHALASTLFAR